MNSSIGSATEQTKINRSVLILGNNTFVSNVTMDWDVYINPGADGNVSLKNVTVTGTIYIESGATHSIHLTNISAPKLSVNSSSPVHIVSSDMTNIQETNVTSDEYQPVTFDNEWRTAGALYIQSGQDMVLT